MEELILQNLMTNADYFGKVYTYINASHFTGAENVQIFRELDFCFKEYDHKPTAKEVGIRIKQSAKIHKDMKQDVIEKFKEILKSEPQKNQDFLISETEKYIQKVELSKAIIDSADIINNGGKFEPIMGMVENALSISFNYDTGFDYNSDDADKHLFEYYNMKNSGLTTGIPSMDDVLAGGFRQKTLNIVSAPSHGGKSIFLVATASAQLLQRKNVLFLSLEMSEEEIARRIDANVLHYSANDFNKMSFEEYKRKKDEVKKNCGRLKIKEFSAGTMNTLKLESLMLELENEDDFKPDIIICDYLTLMSSSRVTLAQSGNNYSYYKSISEELHGFAKKWDLPVLSAAQLNRSAYGNMDVGMDAVADSLGIVQTADVFFAIIATDQLREQNLVIAKFLKNRNTGQLDTITLAVDFPKMKFMDFDGDTDSSGAPSVMPTGGNIDTDEMDAIINGSVFDF